MSLTLVMKAVNILKAILIIKSGSGQYRPDVPSAALT